MAKIETLEEFYRRKFNSLPGNLKREVGHFNVFRLEDLSKPGSAPLKYNRRDFYKISLIRGSNRYHYADKSIEIAGTTLMFFNPQVPYALESLSDDKTGFFCIFKEPFFTEKMKGNINALPMFQAGGKPAYFLTREQDTIVSDIFTRMLDEIPSNYLYKYDLLRNYVMELIHFALKMEPSETLYPHPDANLRIITVFSALLERQFPIESPSQRFALRSAGDFAKQLSIHVNHLNKVIKETTGKTTSAHIFERMVSEAKALLKHTDWNVAEIGYSLGFDEPSHFNNFFKKQTSLTPTAFRIA